MSEEFILEFDTKEYFNSPILKQYDEDGQNYFLGYLIRTEKWNINDNKITFPAIKQIEDIQERLVKYENDVKKTNFKIKKEALNTISVVGMMKYQDILEDEKKEIKALEQNLKEVEER